MDQRRVECPQPPSPQPLTPSGRETLASTGSQGLLLCTEQAEAGVMATAQDRITIYGPKDNGTLHRRILDGRRRCACDLNTANRGGSDPALPGQDALWLVPEKAPAFFLVYPCQYGARWCVFRGNPFKPQFPSRRPAHRRPPSLSLLTL